VPDQSGDIRRYFFLFQVAEKRTDINDRSAAIPQHQRRHAHAQEVFGLGHGINFLSVGMDVNESRRNNHPVGINFPRGRPIHFSNRDDASAFDGNVPCEGWGPGAVNNFPMAHNQVVVLGQGGKCAENRQTKNQGNMSRPHHNQATVAQTLPRINCKEMASMPILTWFLVWNRAGGSEQRPVEV